MSEGFDFVFERTSGDTALVFTRSHSGGRRPFNQTIVKHSPTGFEWGYGGSGPSDLALNMLARLFGKEEALKHYQDFKFAFIATLPREGGVITSTDVWQWVQDRRNQEAATPAE